MPEAILASACVMAIFVPFMTGALPALLVRRKAGVAASTISLVIGIGVLVAVHVHAHQLHPEWWGDGAMTPASLIGGMISFISLVLVTARVLETATADHYF